jgi:hypothetical protein
MDTSGIEGDPSFGYCFRADEMGSHYPYFKAVGIELQKDSSCCWRFQCFQDLTLGPGFIPLDFKNFRSLSFNKDTVAYKSASNSLVT